MPSGQIGKRDYHFAAGRQELHGVESTRWRPDDGRRSLDGQKAKFVAIES
jgi:hypothetical protein